LNFIFLINLNYPALININSVGASVYFIINVELGTFLRVAEAAN